MNIVAFFRERYAHLLVVFSYFVGAIFLGLDHVSGPGLSEIILSLLSILMIFYFVYAYNSFVDLSSDKGPGKKNMFKGQKVDPVKIKFYLVITFVLSFVSSYVVSYTHLLIMSFIGLIGFLYSYPPLRLKNKGRYMKSFSIVISFILMFIFFGLLFSDDYFKIILFGIYFGSLSFSGTIFQDIKDRDSDADLGIMTFAVKYSDMELADMFDNINLSMYFMVLVSWLFGLISPLYLLIILVYLVRKSFGENLRKSNYKKVARMSLYSYISSSLIIFIVWLIHVLV